MLGRYIPLLAAVCVSALIAVAMVIGSFLLGPKKPTRFKVSTYECGMTPVGSARDRFPVRFYLVAMLFIVFDVETVFLYPWAATFGLGSRAERIFLLSEMGVFVAILLVAYFYAISVRVFDWGTERDDLAGQGPEVTDATLKPRPPIRLGNEDSGPVALPMRAEARR